MSTLLDFPLFLSFFSPSASSSHFPLYASSTKADVQCLILCPLHECRRTGRSPPPSNPTPRHTSNTCICMIRRGRAKIMHSTNRISRAYDTSISDVAEALLPVAMVPIGTLPLYYVSRRICVGRYMFCSYGVVWGVEVVSPYVICIGDARCNHGGLMIS